MVLSSLVDLDFPLLCSEYTHRTLLLLHLVLKYSLFLAIGAAVDQWCEFKPRRGKNKNLTGQRSNSNTVWFNFQTYIIFNISLVSQVTLRSSGTDILYGCHLLRCLYNILYFL